MNRIIISIFFLLIFSKCKNQYNQFIYHIKSKEDTLESVLWKSNDEDYSLAIMSSKPTFAIDAPNYWVTLIKNTPSGDIYFSLFRPGNNYFVKNNYFFSYKEDIQSEQYSFSGWYKKRNSIFQSLLNNKQLIFENNLLYEKIDDQFLKTENKIYSYKKELQKKTDSLDFQHQGIFEYKQDKFIKISNNPEIIFQLEEGLFYIPKPGTGIKYKINLEEIINKIEHYKSTHDEYPLSIYFK